MSSDILGLLGLAKKAGMLEVGEEPVGAAARARDARLLLLASDAAENSARRMRHFADAGQCIWVRIPETKNALGHAVGRTGCAMLAVTDIGFAAAIAERLAAGDERFTETAKRLAVKRQRMEERRREAEQHEKNVRLGKKRADAAERSQSETKTTASPPTEKRVPEKRAFRPGTERGRGTAAPRLSENGTAERSGERRVKRTREEKQKLRRTAIKQAERRRYENSRPVRKGKGSIKKENS